jgi:membrane protease YdiL (CAAX protease family)
MPKLSVTAVLWAALYVIIWGGSIAVLSQAVDESASEAMVIGPIFGLIAPLLAWGLTAVGKRETAPIPVARPAIEAWAVIGYLVLYAALFLGWGLSAVREGFPTDPDREFAISALKILAHVILPLGLLAVLGARIAPLLRAHAGRLSFWLPLVVLGTALLGLLTVVSPSLKHIAALDLSSSDWLWAGPGTFIWLVLAVGLCEEFLFRAVLLTRLTAFLKSATGAVIVGAILFGLAHAPGLWLRAEPGEFGHFQDPLFVFAYTVAVLSPTGIFFGVLWARTKSLWLLVLLHVAIDFLPNLPRFVHSFGSLFNCG